MNNKQTQKHMDADYYEIGSTQPPKNHSGIVAFLLILVIMLTGMVSVLGIQNLHLSLALQKNSLSSLSDATPTTVTGNLEDGQPCLCIWGEEVSIVSQYFYQLPAGMRITRVSHQAGTRGIRPGDILLTVNNLPITSQEELYSAIRTLQAGDTAAVTIYREQQELHLTLQVEAMG